METGCVRRRLFVNSNPPGALVYVDNEQIGTTPCAVDFTYYGTREIRLVKPGFETLTLNQPIPTPWYQYPPLDFISENLVPYKIRDNRSRTYNLSPQVLALPQELVARGEQLRQETQQGAILPAAVTVPVVPPGAVPVGPAVPNGLPAASFDQDPAFGPPATPSVPITAPAPLVLPGPPASPQIMPPSTTLQTLPSTAPAQVVPPERGRPLVSPPLR
jgi:hypothetical protein